jgi:predicted GTPase
MAEQEFNFEVTTDLAPVRELHIAANFDKLHEFVAELVAPYKNMVVTEDTAKNASADRARLRKLRERIDQYRKEIKAECMRPVDEFAEGVKPTLAEIDEAVANIDGGVKKWEAVEVQNKMDALRAFFHEKNTGAGAEIADFDKIAAVNPKWKNKGYEVKAAQNDIMSALANIDRGMMALRGPGYPDNCRAAMIERFAQDYDLAAALNVYTQIQRREAMERARQEREAERQAAEQRAREQAERAAEQAVQTAQTAAQATEPATTQNEQPETLVRDFRVWATREQLNALGAFMKANGIRYGKVPKEGA